MDKQIKLYIGIGLLGLGAYLYWKSTQPKANALGRPRSCPKGWTLSSDGTKCVRSTTPMTAKGGYGGSILPKMPKIKMDALPHTIQSLPSGDYSYGSDVPPAPTWNV
jgi:hypothetical protein